ncbi:MAG: FesM [Anaerolineae bacterium]|nr:FesM [Anaerolineae bacterium]
MQLNEKPGRTPRTLHDILTWPLIGPFLRWRYSRRVMQAVLLVITGFIVFDGLIGPQQAPKNLATVSTWVEYRGVVVLALLVAGNLFCMACPFMLPREVGRWLGAKLGWQGSVPKALRNKWLAAGLLIGFFILYEYYDLWASPWLTAWIIVAYFLTALVVDTFFQGAAFCKYVCPLGQFNFFGSLHSPTEIAIRRAETCQSCQTKDCIAGNQRTGQRGCELWLFQEKKSSNMDCTFCLDCVYACPHDNIGLKAQVPMQTLWSDPRRAGLGRFSERWDLTALMMVIVTAAYLNAFGMITPVYALQQSISDMLNTTSELPSLLIIFGVGFLVIPVVVLAITGQASRLLAGRREDSLGFVIRRFGYTLVPLGFGVWLSHYAFHFLTGALTVIPVVQSFLNDVGLYAGTPQWQLGPIVPSSWLFPLQTIFLYLGIFGSLITGFQVAIHQYRNRHVALRAFMPWAVLAVLLLLAFWIMLQPMEMRGTLFMGL